MTDAEIEVALGPLDGWRLDGNKIQKEFLFADFNEAFRFLTGVAILAEKANHHPEIWNVYNRVRLCLSTHEAGGLTALDFALAAAVEKLA
jgi:4a-hydroxytetrahydrobiopterin dehydratase